MDCGRRYCGRSGARRVRCADSDGWVVLSLEGFLSDICLSFDEILCFCDCECECGNDWGWSHRRCARARRIRCVCVWLGGLESLGVFWFLVILLVFRFVSVIVKINVDVIVVGVTVGVTAFGALTQMKWRERG